MCFLGKYRKRVPEVSVAGLHLKNPAGLRQCSGGPLLNARHPSGAGFITLCPPNEHVLDWILQLQEYRKNTVLAVNLTRDIAHSFSLMYDFSDLLIADPEGEPGIDAPDISDITLLLDEMVNLRLCYEQYTPIALRLSLGSEPEEVRTLLNHCRLSGIDAVVAPGPRKVRQVMQETQGRLPVIGSAQTVEEALECLQAGASLVETSLGIFAFQKLLKSLAQ